MHRETAAELIRQVQTGKDIPPPAKLLNMSAAQASIQMDGSPYSIATNLAHTVFWQDHWLSRLQGERGKNFIEDWRVPEVEEWGSLRASFLEGLDRALAIAESEPFTHKMSSDNAAVSALVQIGVHAAYHLGQINLLKRQLRLRR
jgi:hypothetical protein